MSDDIVTVPNRSRGPEGGDPVRREAILDAATTLFGNQGFSATTTDEVAAAAGVTKRTLYRYMGSKDGILVAIHERFLDRSTMDIAGRPHASASEQLVQMIHHHSGVVARHQKEIRVFFEEMKHLPPEARQRVVGRRDQYEDLFRDVLRRGIDDGEFRVVDVPIAAQAILGALTNMYRWYQPGGPLSPGDIATCLSEWFLHGACVRGASGHDAVAPAPELTVVTGNGTPSPASPWDTNPVLTRILDSAITLFAAKGYHAASTRELADAAGLTKSALYYYIGQKEAALLQIHQKVTDKGIESASKVLAEGGPPAPALRRLIHEHCQIMETYQRAIAVFSDELKFLSPENLDKVIQHRRVYTALWRQALENGVRSGEFSVPDLKVVTVSMLGLLNYMYLWYRPGGRLRPADIAQQFSDLILLGLAADPA